MLLAMARATGWPEHVIMHMAFPRVLSYLHANMLLEGLNTDWSTSTASEQAAVDEKMKLLLRKR